MENVIDVLQAEEEPEEIELPRRKKKVGKLDSRQAILVEGEKVYREARKGLLKSLESKRLLECLRLYSLMFSDAPKEDLEQGANLEALRAASAELAELEEWERENNLGHRQATRANEEESEEDLEHEF